RRADRQATALGKAEPQAQRRLAPAAQLDLSERGGGSSPRNRSRPVSTRLAKVWDATENEETNTLPWSSRNRKWVRTGPGFPRKQICVGRKPQAATNTTNYFRLSRSESSASSSKKPPPPLSPKLGLSILQAALPLWSTTTIS
ncbi:hypothetical protein LEMLEM_LOCUS3672, partial [Lemmus lemmus]